MMKKDFIVRRSITIVEGKPHVETYSEEPLVRCKDCRYWLPMNRFHEDFHPGRGECELNCWVRDSDWFCADGEVR